MINIWAVDTHPHAISPPNSPAAPASPVWVTVRPEVRRGASVAADLLTSLGKNLTWHGKGRNEHEDIQLAIAWMLAMESTTLVVINTQEAPLATMNTLRTIAQHCNIDLWLAYRAPIDDRTLRKTTKMATRTATIDQLPKHQARSAPPTPQQSAIEYQVPADDFPTFAVALRHGDALHPGLADYHDQLTSTTQAINDESDARAAILTAANLTLRNAPHQGELVARLRALQVIAWRHDMFLDVDLATLIPSADRPRVAGSALDEQLTAYRQPQRAIVSALTLRGTPLAKIAALTLDDATPTGDLPSLNLTTPATPALQTAVRAQVVLRQLQGADSAHRLLLPDSKSLARFVNDATADLGINLAGRRVERELTTDTWLKRLGITLRNM